MVLVPIHFWLYDIKIKTSASSYIKEKGDSIVGGAKDICPQIK